MFLKKKKANELSNKLDLINNIFEKLNLRDLADLLGNKKQIFWRNFFAGIARGMGMAIGFTILRCGYYLCTTKNCCPESSCYWRIHL